MANLTFRPTDLHNLEIFEKLGEGRVLFVSDYGKWYKYNGKIWVEDKQKTEPEKIAIEVVKENYKIASKEYDAKTREAIGKWALQSEDEKRRKAVIGGAERSSAFVVNSDIFDQDDFLYCCENGVVELKTQKLLPHDPKYLMTMISPCNYNPDAVNELWLDTINKAMCFDTGLIDFIQKYAGLSLTGDVNQKILAFLYGPSGNNAKSTVTQAILHVMGLYGRQISVNTLMKGAKRQPGAASPDIAELNGIRYLLTSETEEDAKFNDQIIKDLTGRDKMHGRKLWGDPTTFSPKMKIWIYGNYKPNLRGNSQPMRNRMKLIPFEYKFVGAEEDPEAQDKIIANADGVLTWMVEGYRKFLEEGIPEPEAIKAATDEYFYENDRLKRYFNDFLIEDKTGDILFSDLYEEATDYLGWKMSKRKFSDTLKSELNIDVVPGYGNQRVVKGYRKPVPGENLNSNQEEMEIPFS